MRLTLRTHLSYRFAYYTVLIKPGFRLVSINTNYCNNQNFWLYLDVKDPAGELQWLIQVLQSAEDNKEKVNNTCTSFTIQSNMPKRPPSMTGHLFYRLTFF